MPFGRGARAKQWARFAMKIGLFLTDSKLWSAVNEQMKERASDLRDSMRASYKETSSRLEDAQDALHGRAHWLGHTTSFLGGIGIGIGLGMLLAPVSGEEARSAIRGKAADVKSKVSDFATGSTSYRSSSTPTGTMGD
jgi:gas vesicle protein